LPSTSALARACSAASSWRCPRAQRAQRTRRDRCRQAFGTEFAAAQRVLATYTGVARRFQPIGAARGIRFIDDYAHHPTEIAATLAPRARPSRARAWSPCSSRTCTAARAIWPPHSAGRSRPQTCCT